MTPATGAPRLEDAPNPDSLSRAELLELRHLANYGEVVGPLLHEFNNFLNAVLLHIAVLESEVSTAARADLLAIRRHGNSIADLIRQLQQYRDRRRPVRREIDLNDVVEAAAASLAMHAISSSIRLDLRDRLPPVAAAYVELYRLCEFLIRNAAAVSSVRGVVVRTGPTSGGVALQVEDSGPEIPAAAIARLFEPVAEERPGASRLELAACKSLANRLGARLEAEPGSAGGIIVTVELPLAT